MRYRVSIAAGLPAREPVATSAALTKEVAFDAGRAATLFFRLRDAPVHRRHAPAPARLGERPAPPCFREALHRRRHPGSGEAYDKYDERPEDQEGDESYSRESRSRTCPAREIWSKDFTTGAAIDRERRTTLDWNQIVGANRTGAVMLTAESIDPITPGGKRVGTQTLIQLTDLGAVWKRDGRTTVLHLFSLASGKGLAAARLRLLDREGQQLAQATTGTGGDAQLPQISEARWIFAETEADAHLIPISVV